MGRSAKIFVAGYFLASCVLMLAGALVPAREGPVAVFAWPWGDSAVSVVARSGGPVVFVGDRNWVALTETGEQQSIASLYRSGAGFVASSFIAQACARLSGVSLEQMK
ncbi:hypothetical protein V1T76_04365 [Roseibium sp. FZY0029]|uniref:hypothetical protein n=1 Tax=Roseibium sp. FZY0029 TaxID=3116647 RepID=UPI002E9E1F0B|nr:hypothetical protein [Roseibium sp. FZY0029]